MKDKHLEPELLSRLHPRGNVGGRMRASIPTGRILALAIALLLGVEALTFVDSAQENTISEVVWRSVVGRPIIPFLVGLLCGHFFWQRKEMVR